jgi:hypothetical protein
MESEKKNRIRDLRITADRKEKRSLAKSKLKILLSKDSFEFLSFEESDSFQLKVNEWHKDKWDDKLFVQTPITKPKPVEDILINFLNLI